MSKGWKKYDILPHRSISQEKVVIERDVFVCIFISHQTSEEHYVQLCIKAQRIYEEKENFGERKENFDA